MQNPDTRFEDTACALRSCKTVLEDILSVAKPLNRDTLLSNREREMVRELVMQCGEIVALMANPDLEMDECRSNAELILWEGGFGRRYLDQKIAEELKPIDAKQNAEDEELDRIHAEQDAAKAQ